MSKLSVFGFANDLQISWAKPYHPTGFDIPYVSSFAIVATENLECCQFDIKDAFTESKLQERVFLSAPQGVEVKKGHVLCVL